MSARVPWYRTKVRMHVTQRAPDSETVRKGLYLTVVEMGKPFLRNVVMKRGLTLRTNVLPVWIDTIQVVSAAEAT